jgi:hypothetical protein
MKSLPIVVAMLFGAGAVSAGDTAGKPSTDANPGVRIAGDTLIYVGGINEKGENRIELPPPHSPAPAKITSAGKCSRGSVRPAAPLHVP